MFGKNKKTTISIDDYVKYRDQIIEWLWIAETYDSDTKEAVYKPTKRGVDVYSAIVRLIGTDNIVNNFKLTRPEVEMSDIIPYYGATSNDPIIAQALMRNKIMTKSYDMNTNTEKYELTPYGAYIFIAFFVSLNRHVGTLPGDKMAKFVEIMNKMPEYSMKVSGIIKNIADGLAQLEKIGGGSSTSKNFGGMPRDMTPRNYAWKDTSNIDETGRRMMNNFNNNTPHRRPKTKYRAKPKNKRKTTKPKKKKYDKPYHRTGPEQMHDFYSRSGRRMMWS